MVDVSVYNHSPHSPHTVESGDVSLEWERYQVIEKALKSFREVLPLVLQWTFRWNMTQLHVEETIGLEGPIFYFHSYCRKDIRHTW